jgi:hypothetical protein
MTSYHKEESKTKWITWLLLQQQMLSSQTFAETIGGKVSMQLGTKALSL